MLKNFTLLFFVFVATPILAQDLVMQNGTFQRCGPDRFFDSGGESGNYGSNEDFEITICPENAGEVIAVDFITFRTELNNDILTIFDGDTTAASIIGSFSGQGIPGFIVSTSPSGCLTFTYSTNGFGNSTGWSADISCGAQCQDITAVIDNTLPAINPSTNQIEILPNQTIDFSGSALFSDTDVNATYLWNFDTGATATTLNASHQFNTPGIFNVQFTATDANPLGCSDTVTITVAVLDSIVTINNSTFNESSFSPQQLIEDVLVTGGCAAVTNFESLVFGSPTELNTKSYGYFTRGGLTEQEFPFDSGIVLSTGSAFTGGNVITNQPGETGETTGASDQDLETALMLTGTSDATFIKFDFVPTTNNITFRYLMASEEYDMGSECQFADGFAFLIREVGTTTYTNLAVLPDGNNTQVNVFNINEAPLCAANVDFFAGYNLGATNFGGRTEVLEAVANNLSVGVTYEIKLVVADVGDNLFDTAIFIEAGSFNLGGDLGEDITLANGNARCGGEDVTLDTQAPNADHTWFFNGIEIPGEINSTLIASAEGTYSVLVEFAEGCTNQDFITVEFRESPEIAAPPIDLAGCSTTGTSIFNLAQNTPIVFGTQSTTDYSVSYHNTQQDADLGVNPITNLTNYNGIDGEIIYVRIQDVETQRCEDTASFTLSVFTTVISNDVTYQVCDNNNDGDDANGISDFDLSLINNQVLGTQDPTQFSVSYHATQNDADTGNNPFPNIITNGAQSLIFARVQNNSNFGCFETSNITLQVNPLPVISANVDLRQCDTDTDGLSEFNLTEANDLISTNAVNETFTYYTTLADAQNANNPITTELNYPNTDPSANPDTLFVRVENNNLCFRVAQLELFVSTSQIPAGFNIPPYEECDDTRIDNNITDGITTFDFSDATAQITALFPTGQNITVTYFETTADALAETNAIPDITNHVNTTSPFNQTIIYRVDNNTDNSCQGIGEFQLITNNPMPRTDTDTVDLILCDDVTIGDLSEAFDLTQNEAFIFNGIPNLSATYFSSMSDALANTNTITTPTTYSNTTPTETIYVRVTDTVTTCFAIVDFDITVNPLPNTVVIETLQECENGTDGIFDFDLSSKIDEILNGQDPTVFTVSFHINQTDADNLANPLPNTFTNTTNPQPIFIAITNNDTGCSVSTQTFNVEVIEGAQANSDGEPLDFELCDDNILNDGVAQFDLISIQDEILDGQNLADVTVAYYFSMDDALNNTNPLPTLYENLTNPQTIFVRVSNNINPDVCFEIQPIPLRVNPLPVFDLDETYVLCTTTNGSEVVPVPPVIDTGLSTTDFSFEWSLDGVPLPTETEPSLTPTQGGTYSVSVFDITTSTITRCSSSDTTTVIESDLPVLSAEVTSQAFANNHIIEASAEGTSTYEFSLDNGPWQDNGIFENVSAGTHTVYSRDINGCGIVSVTVLVIDYPLFFTPNGDGNNDTWNIVGIETQPIAKIYIFDRYGKLLKQLSPTSPGWDGTYRGNRLPTADYWFTVEYTEPLTGDIKQQRAHFTLKR